MPKAVMIGFEDQGQLLHQAIAYHQAGNLAEAEWRYAQILDLNGTHFVAMYHLGVIRAQQSRYIEAERLIGGALQIDASLAVAFVNYGNVLTAIGRSDEALTSFERALAVDPENAEAMNGRGNIFLTQNRFEEALASYDAVLVIHQNNADAWNNRGFALRALKRFDEAAHSCGRALDIEPHFVEALNNLGITLSEMKRFEEALANYDAALSINAEYVDGWTNRGSTLLLLNRPEEALASFQRALTIRADSVAALNGCGNAFFHLQRFDDSLESFDKALAILPEYVDAWNNRGRSLLALKRDQEALASYDRVLAIDVNNPLAFGGAAAAALNICAWKRTSDIAAQLGFRIASGASMPPFTALGLSDDKAILLKCAKNAIADIIPGQSRPLFPAPRSSNKKIRIGYISSDFREHAVSHLIVGLIERHDRTRFEIVGVSTGPNDGSEIRNHIAKTFDRFHEVYERNPAAVAAFLNKLELDILVDLNGHTEGHSLAALSYRPCAIQVTYLGYPGTSGSNFIDYIIADPIVAPFSDEPYYSEKIVHLPDCYLVNNSKSLAVPDAPARQEVGLPDNSFVFCCFNNNWKITGPIFDIWMRLLRNTPDSVLWLRYENEAAMTNLCAAAGARDVDGNRIIFARRQSMDLHLARHRAADLFLDTLPYNAHTTASDALWAGLPLLTCQGSTFAGRVAASMLHALEVPELVTRSLEDYEAVAAKLARDRSRLRALKEKIERHRLTAPLFDIDRFRQHLETAFTTMLDIQSRGEAPSSFSVSGKARRP